jgi:beta-lactamase class A
LVVLGLAGSTLTASATTTAEEQLAWLVQASAHQPIPTADITAHVAPVAITAAGGAAALSQTFAAFGQLTVEQTVTQTPTEVRVIASTAIGTAMVTLAVDGTGLIEGLQLSPYMATPTSWAQLDSSLKSLAPQVSFATSVLSPGGQCRVVNGIAANTQRPLGSAFKLYVLGALGQAVADHRASWNEQLAIHDQWKSLPSGVMQNYPAGTEFTLAQYADNMISISDNTAADHLIHFLGRDAVQAQLFRFGNSRPQSDIPFLTTRDLFVFKGDQYPKLADAYLALPRPLRPAGLAAADQVPLADVQVWPTPEDINQLEWFASPTDICRAYAGLWRENAQPGQSAIGTALSINDGGLGLDPSAYPTVWYKGGSEPGVLTMNFLVRAADGKIVVTSVMLGNPTANINEWTAIGTAEAAVRGAVALSR